ncbi:spore coat protein [Paenibacillus turpanensis]|uniref:spore coat protein n=1 Tax=Paenibacillus turpanensis TaxID=2689078 RepID=UPI001FB7664D|nr:spore coat protein [Paenibacillus turpanensis]
MMRNWAAHEFLETNELLRKLTADIELHALCAEMTTDRDLKHMLQRHIQLMDATYHQAVNLLRNKGMDVTASRAYQLHAEHHPHVGFQNPHMIPAPNTNATRLNDVTIGTLILNSHKAGAMFGMLWANECVDPDVRSLHVTSANNCQQMAYEVFQLMNQRGFYEVPTMPANDVRAMTQTFQPAARVTDRYYGVHHIV